MALNQLIAELATEADRLKTIEVSGESLATLWVRGVETLYDRIQGIYLVNYLRQGQVRLVRVPVWNYAPRLGRFEVLALQVRVADRCITLRPEYRPAATHLGVVLIEANAGEPAGELELGLRDSGWCWMAPAPASGLRGLLRFLLPRQLVPLDEPTFVRLLETVLLGPQPVFNTDGDAIRAHVATLLERGSAIRIDERIGQAGILLRRGSWQVASRLRRTARALLPGQERPQLGFSPVVAPEDEHGPAA